MLFDVDILMQDAAIDTIVNNTAVYVDALVAAGSSNIVGRVGYIMASLRVRIYDSIPSPILYPALSYESFTLPSPFPSPLPLALQPLSKPTLFAMFHSEPRSASCRITRITNNGTFASSKLSYLDPGCSRYLFL